MTTEATSKPHWWSANSAVLDVRADDIDTSTGEKRAHDGHIVFHQGILWLATRIDRYADSNEIAQQQLVIAADFDIVYVTGLTGLKTASDLITRAFTANWRLIPYQRNTRLSALQCHPIRQLQPL